MIPAGYGIYDAGRVILEDYGIYGAGRMILAEAMGLTVPEG